MKTRKLQCRIQLAASEPVAYRLVIILSSPVCSLAPLIGLLSINQLISLLRIKQHNAACSRQSVEQRVQLNYSFVAPCSRHCPYIGDANKSSVCLSGCEMGV